MNEKKREQENVLRLVKKSRKGILRVVFSRFGLMALLLVLELVLLWMMWRWFNNDFEWFAAVQGVFTVLMFFHLFNSDMDATGKLTWMFLFSNSSAADEEEGGGSGGGGFLNKKRCT